MHVENTFTLGGSERIRAVPRTSSRPPSHSCPSLCNRARAGFPGPLSLSFSPLFLHPLYHPSHGQAIDPEAHGSWQVPVVPLLLPIGVSPALEVPPRQQARVPCTCVPCFRPNVLACFTLFNFVCVSPKLPWHAFSLLSRLSTENPRSRPPLHRCYIPSPTDFVGKVCLPRITIPVFEIEPGSAHTHTSQPGNRYHPHLHALLHKTTSQTLLRPSVPTRTRSIRFPENRIVHRQPKPHNFTPETKRHTFNEAQSSKVFYLCPYITTPSLSRPTAQERKENTEGDHLAIST